MSASNWRQNMPTSTAYWMNRVLFDIHHKQDHLERYLQNPDRYLSTVALGPEQRDAIRDNDIGAMYLEGVNPYLLRAHCLGLHIPEREFLASLRAVEGEANHG